MSQHQTTTSSTQALRPTLGFGIALGLLSVLGPLSIDLYLPALPELAAALDTSSGAAQRTLSAFFLALAVAQIPIGSVGDRFGRLPPLMIGLGLFVVASIGCALASSIDQLIAWRILQGLGACAGTAVARAMIRDLHVGHDAARLMAFSFLVIGASPVIAPYLGTLLLEVVPWRGLFLVLAGAGLLALVVVAALLPESLPPSRRAQRGTPMLPAYVALFRNRMFMAWAVIAGLATTIPFAYLTAAPFIFTGSFALDARGYSLLLALSAVASIVGAQSSPVLMKRWGGQMLVLRIGAMALGATLLLALWATAAPVPLIVFQVYSMLMFKLAGVMLTPAVITALDAASGGAGAAAGLAGTIQLAITALASMAVSLMPSVSLLPLFAVFGAALTLALVLAARARVETSRLSLRSEP